MNVEGDRRTAIGYTRVYHHTPEGYEVWQVSANRWELQRTPDGWRVARRTTQVMDGTLKANDLLSQAFDQ